MSKSNSEKVIDEFIENVNNKGPRKRAKRDDGAIAMLELLDPLELNDMCGDDEQFRMHVDGENRRAVVKAQHLLHLVLEEMMSEERLEGTNLDDLRKTADAAAKISQLLNNKPTAIAGKSGDAIDALDDVSRKPHSQLSDDELKEMMERTRANKHRLEHTIGPVKLDEGN